MTTDPVETNPEWVPIPARSRRQAMDWSLVLTSQEIPTAIFQSDESGWALLVAPGDRDRALGSIRQYRVENRRWVFNRKLSSGSTFELHWGGALWCLILVFVHAATLAWFPLIGERAAMSSLAVSGGEWWRLFTAILLHADLAHLMANVTMGALLLGIVMAQYGPALGLLGPYLAAALGFGAGWLLYPDPYRSVGASGMVMGALGMVAVHSLSHWRARNLPGQLAGRAILAGVLLFVLLGLDPTSDVLAHFGGFVGGVLIGIMFNLVPERWRQSGPVEWAAWMIFYSLVVGTSVLVRPWQ